jgi:hypothetical protein
VSTEPQLWVCPNCEKPVATHFCGNCGERPIPPHDLSFAGVAGKVLHAATSIDGQLLTTLKMLVARPGFLTAAHVVGRRMPFLAPLKVFLFANAVFFAIQSLTGVNVFSSTLESHMQHQDWSELARSLVDRHLRTKNTTLNAYSPLFDRSVILYAKSLVILMVLPFSALLPIWFWNARKPFMTHLTFGLHLYAFLLLLFCAAIMFAKLQQNMGGGGLESPSVDLTLSLINLLACGTYVYIASGVVYDARGWTRWLRAAALALTAGAIVVGYRFLLLLITLTMT